MDSTPLGKVLNEDNVISLEEKDEEFIKFRKKSLSKKRRDEILRKYQTVSKKRRSSS